MRGHSTHLIVCRDVTYHVRYNDVVRCKSVIVFDNSSITESYVYRILESNISLRNQRVVQRLIRNVQREQIKWHWMYTMKLTLPHQTPNISQPQDWF